VFQHLRDINSRDGVPTLFVYLPTQRDLRGDPPVRHMVGSLTDELGVSFVDLTPLLRALPARQAAQMFLPDGHYSVEGNRWVAEVLSAQLAELPVSG
jgi:hypothetical protein